MGIWLVTLGVGGKVAGLLSEHVVISPDIASSRHSMAQGFLSFLVLSIVGKYWGAA